MNEASAAAFSVLLILVVGLFFWRIWDDTRHHHRWGKYGEPKIVRIVVNGVTQEGQVRFQERYCETCGKGEAKRMVDPL